MLNILIDLEILPYNKRFKTYWSPTELYDLRDFSISLLPKISMENSSVAFDLNGSEVPEFRGTLLVLITYAFSVFGDVLLFK